MVWRRPPQLVEEELAPYCRSREPRARIGRPTLALALAAAQSIAVALHELTTNAAKYGTLSGPTGQVEVEWWHAADGRLVFRWSETGGLPVTPPAHRGFGSNVIEQVIRHQLQGAVCFD